MKLKTTISVISIKIFLLFVTLYYVIPFVSSFFFQSQLRQSYNLPESNTFLLIIPIVIIISIVLDAVLPIVTLEDRVVIRILKRIFTDLNFNLGLSLIFFSLSIYFFSNYSISFRYRNQLSEEGMLPILIFTLGVYFKSFLLGQYLGFLIGEVINLKRRLIALIITVSFVLSATASYDILFAGMSFLLVIRGERLIIGESTNFKKYFLKLFGYSVGLVILSFVLLMGIANKYGFDETKMLLSDGTVVWLVIRRISMWYISVLTAGEAFFNNYFFSLDGFNGLITDTVRRLQIILGNTEVHKPEIWGINRMNNLVTYRVTNEYGGSSPGLFASVFYIPAFPLNLILICLYLVFVLRRFTFALSSSKAQLSLVGIFAFMVFMTPFFESPIEILNTFSKSFMIFVLNLIWLKIYSK